MANPNKPFAWELGEFGLIDRIRQLFPDIDLTDDCALIGLPTSGKLLITTDAAIRGTHFPEDGRYISDGGFRGFAGAVSDINASAGRPLGALLALVIPKDLLLSEFDSFMSGVVEYSSISGVPLIGGNITRGDRFGATFTIIGTSERPVARASAKPGDLLVLTGAVGGSEAGRMLITGEVETKGIERKVIDALKNQHLRPIPPLGTGERLAKLGATAIIDISDGFLADAAHIAETSGVKIGIELANLPLFPGVEEVAEIAGLNPYLLAAKSGEEFEIIASVPLGTDLCVSLENGQARGPAPTIPPVGANLVFAHSPNNDNRQSGKRVLRTPTIIGEVSEGKGLKITLNGESVEPKDVGWRHF